GHQFNEGHINTSPLENYQTISTPVDVKGVSVNVNCGGYTPVPYGILHKSDHKKQHEFSRNCTDGFCNLLKKTVQSPYVIEESENKEVDIYFSSEIPLTNPIEDQVITKIKDCCIVQFKDSSQSTIVPKTTVKLSQITGISATDTGETTNIFNVLLNQANDTIEKKENDKHTCVCLPCANAIGQELISTAEFGLLIDVFIKELDTALNLYVNQFHNSSF